MLVNFKSNIFWPRVKKRSYDPHRSRESVSPVCGIFWDIFGYFGVFEISSNVKLDFFQCEIGFLSMSHWISYNVKLDFFQCQLEFLLMSNLISSSVKLDFFQSLIGFVPMSNWISSNVKLYFFQYKIVFLPISN